jgi:phytoene dehydrogenase-like protein
LSDFDVTVVGAGPNGLAAAVEMARHDRHVLVVEAHDSIGGGTRTEELTLPGFRHDVCSAIHPAAVASPFFNELQLDVDWIQPPIPFTHPLGEGRVVALHRSVEETAGQFGEDAETYEKLMTPFAERAGAVIEDALAPVTLTPDNPGTFARLAAIGPLSSEMLISRFDTVEARSLLAGLAAHSIAPFSRLATAPVGVLLGALGHSHGWPLARGGSASIADALAQKLEESGGQIETGRLVKTLGELPSRQVFLDLMPPAAAGLARDRLNLTSRARLRRWRAGPGIFKVDWALDGPVPWLDPLSSNSATVHVGGTYEEIRASEDAVAKGKLPDYPFVLFAQQSLFDETRAPQGKHTGWAYCHVPNGSSADMTDRIEAQVERFAPGFRDLILARATRSPAEFEAYNPNFVGGDIGGGVYGLRKVLQLGDRRPYEIGADIYLCSSATPPGAGVHGMCGYHAAAASLD